MTTLNLYTMSHTRICEDKKGWERKYCLPIINRLVLLQTDFKVT